ncbi:MAG TPA: 2-succinyl-6-hydroxy-2,4-cyclohexadiene-1-carboxylate synthase [Dehalococcoidia bacterium]
MTRLDGGRSGRIAVNGIDLNVAVSGEGPALLLLHGFTGSSATWEPFLTSWRGFTAIAVDLPGHGASDSPADPARYSMEHCVKDIVALMDRLGVERAAALGYSMGGRVALHLALAAPERLRALVLESASPGIEDPAERAARRESDEALAADIDKDGVEAFVSHWEALSLFASQARLPAALRNDLRRQRLSSNPVGLANSLRGMGAGEQESLWRRLGEISVPALVVAGELDEKYSALTHRMAAAMPDARAEVVAQAGHAIHLEQPNAYATLVRRFLEECLSRERPEEVLQ